MLTERVAFHLGSKEVYWYGVMVALGFVAGMLLLRWRAKKVGLPPDQVGDLVFFALVGGLLGARLMYVVSYWREFSGNYAEILRIDHGGLVFYGGFIGGAAAVTWGVYRRGLPVWQVADLIAQALPLGEALGRVGCFLNGCCFGKPTASALGVVYQYPPHGSVWQRQAAGRLLPAQAINDYVEHGIAQCNAVLPSQLFDSTMNLVLCAAMIYLATRLRPAGKTFAWFLIWYALGRFTVEFTRGDYLVLRGGLTDAQWVSLVLLPVGLVLLWWRWSVPAAPAPAAPTAAK